MLLNANVTGQGAQLINVKPEVRTSDPGSPGEGRYIWRSDTKRWRVYDGTGWRNLRDESVAITSADIQDGTIVDADVAAANKDGAVGTASMRTLGLGAQQALPGTTRLDQLQAPTADVPMAAHTLTGIRDATANNEPASLGQLASVAAGKDYKDSVRAATGSVDTGVTATIAGGAVTQLATNSSYAVDAVNLAPGDRLLIKTAPAATGALSATETSQPANGIYVVGTTSASVVTVSRATDADTSAEVSPGMTTWVEQGNQSGTEWTVNTSIAITLNTTGFRFAQTGSATPLSASLPLTLTGMALALGYAAPLGLNGSNQLTITGQVAVANGGTAADASTAAGKTTARGNLSAAGVYESATLGDGAATTFTVTAATHNLGTGKLFRVAVYDVTTATASVEIQVDVTVNRTTGDVTVSGFLTAPAANTIRVVIVG